MTAANNEATTPLGGVKKACRKGKGEGCHLAHDEWFLRENRSQGKKKGDGRSREAAAGEGE